MTLCLTLPALGIFFGLALSACGGGSSSSTSSAGSSQRSSFKEAHAKGPSAEAKGATKVSSYGHEATGKQAKAAEAVVRGYLSALAGGRWSKACSYLTRPASRLRAFGAKAEGRGEGCAAGLRAAVEKLPSSRRSHLAEADVSSVRLDSGRGYVLYDSAGSAYAAAVRSEDGRWKVALPSETLLHA